MESNLLCDIFPFLQDLTFAKGLCGNVEAEGQGAVDAAVSLAGIAVSLIFVGIIAIAIFVIIKAAVKYIQSEGDESKVEEATKAIKNVFIGIGALIIGIIGLVIILALFSSGGNPLDTPDIPSDIGDVLN